MPTTTTTVSRLRNIEAIYKRVVAHCLLYSSSCSREYYIMIRTQWRIDFFRIITIRGGVQNRKCQTKDKRNSRVFCCTHSKKLEKIAHDPTIPFFLHRIHHHQQRQYHTRSTSSTTRTVQYAKKTTPRQPVLVSTLPLRKKLVSPLPWVILMVV